MTPKREVLESPVSQGVDEEIVYTINTHEWTEGGTPTSISAVVKDVTYLDNVTTVTTTVFPANSPTGGVDLITLSPLKALTEGHSYRVEVKFTCALNKFETFAIVNAEL